MAIRTLALRLGASLLAIVPGAMAASGADASGNGGHRPMDNATNGPTRFTIRAIVPVQAEPYPAGTLRLTYASGVDGVEDWALFLPGDPRQNTVVYLHGSFAHADQIFTRADIRNFWLPRIQRAGHPLLSVNLRDTAYMSPAATTDFTALLDFCGAYLGCNRFVLLGGSGGASSAIAYAVVHPEKIHGVVAMGMCDIFERLAFARRSANPVLQKLASTVFAAYGGTPEETPEPYQARSVLAHCDRLTMPVVLTMGEKDALIPVEETRRIAAAMQGRANFVYHEVANGDHDSALWVDVDLANLTIRPAVNNHPAAP